MGAVNPKQWPKVSPSSGTIPHLQLDLAKPKTPTPQPNPPPPACCRQVRTGEPGVGITATKVSCGNCLRVCLSGLVPCQQRYRCERRSRELCRGQMGVASIALMVGSVIVPLLTGVCGFSLNTFIKVSAFPFYYGTFCVLFLPM